MLNSRAKSRWLISGLASNILKFYSGIRQLTRVKSTVHQLNASVTTFSPSMQVVLLILYLSH